MELHGLGRFLFLARPLLWLVAFAASGLLIEWLYLDPDYEMHWSSWLGAGMAAPLGVFAGANCILSFVAVVGSFGDDLPHHGEFTEPQQYVGGCRKFVD